MHKCQSQSSNLPSPTCPLVTISLFSASILYFCFVDNFVCSHGINFSYVSIVKGGMKDNKIQIMCMYIF